MEREQAELLANQAKAVPVVRDALVEFTLELAASAGDSVRAATAHGLLDRVACWMTTLAKLNTTADYQAYACALRAVIETTVDLVLLVDDPSKETQLAGWEQSAKFKGAERVLRNAGQAHLHSVMQDYVNKHRLTVVAFRVAWSNRHPDRWTGRSLEQDAATADALQPVLELRDAYAELNHLLCWGVHGSGLALARNAGPKLFAELSFISIMNCSRLAMACAELALSLADRLDGREQDMVRTWNRKWREASGLPPLEAQ